NCVVLAASCLLVACSGTDSPPSGAISAAAFQTTPCPQPNIAGFPELDFRPGVRCGYLTVPENRAKPNGRRIRIFVMRAPAVSATPKPDPIAIVSAFLDNPTKPVDQTCAAQTTLTFTTM